MGKTVCHGLHATCHNAISKSKLTEVAVETRQGAVDLALAVTSSAYQTSLLAYLIQRDLFPAIMKVG